MLRYSIVSVRAGLIQAHRAVQDRTGDLHRFVDTDNDPYSINKGFFFAHFGWMLTTDGVAVDMEPYARDLKRDRL